MRSKKVILLVAVVGLVAGRVVCSAESVETVTIPLDEIGKCGLKADAVSRLLALDTNAFDQSFGGFRSLGFRQCYVDAAMVIDLYLSLHSERMTPIERVALRFHAGQMYAHSGESLYSVAAVRMQESVDDSSLPSWRAYVDATVAYLRRDLATLKKQRDLLVAVSDSQSNNLNLAVVDRLIKCFDRPYAEAYNPQLCPL